MRRAAPAAWASPPRGPSCRARSPSSSRTTSPRPGSPTTKPVADTLRRLALFRARFAVGLLLLPTLLVACSDFVRRGRRIVGFGAGDWAWYGAALLESAALWASL